MSKTNPIADRLRVHAKMYERMAQEAATESVADLFRYMARECLGAAADAESAPPDDTRKSRKSGLSDGN